MTERFSPLEVDPAAHRRQTPTQMRFSTETRYLVQGSAWRFQFARCLGLSKGDEAAHGIAPHPDLAVSAPARVVAGDEDHPGALDLFHHAYMSVHHANGAGPGGCGFAVMGPIAREVGALTDPHRHL